MDVSCVSFQILAVKIFCKPMHCLPPDERCQDVLVGMGPMRTVSPGPHWLSVGLSNYITTCIFGATENARLELSAPSKMQGVENAGLELSAPYYRGWKMRDWNYRHQNAGGGKCGNKELWNAKAPCFSGSQKIICPIICWKYQCCNCVFQCYVSVSDRLDPYGYEMCVNLISFYVQCYGLQSVKRNTQT